MIQAPIRLRTNEVKRMFEFHVITQYECYHNMNVMPSVSIDACCKPSPTGQDAIFRHIPTLVSQGLE